MKKIFFLPAVALAKVGLFLLAPLLAQGQTPEYQRFMDAGKRELRSEHYDLAGKKFTAALEFASTQPEQKAARLARVDAERLRVQALENALREANRQKDLAEAETNRAQEAEKKATAVLDKIYFYQDRYGLAFDKSAYQYGFIDKNLQTKIAYKYQEALPFDWTGYAKVKRYNQYFFVDTLGNEYPLATELSQLNSKITALDLMEKGLIELPDTVLKSTQLKVLLLAGNQLAQLPPEIGNLTKLQSLDLRGNQLAQLPPEIGILTNLQSLPLGGNALAHLPLEIGNLTHLQSLRLSFNQLASLPPEIGNLTNLPTLDLPGNKLAQLPLEIGNLTNLQSLELRFNQLAQLPPEIGNLTNLQSLGLYRNQLASLPPEIGNLAKLQSLDLSENQLVQLPPEIGKLSNLQSLYLYGNPLSAEYIKKLRAEMLWCEIEWYAPVQAVEEVAEEPPNQEALFEQNEAERTNQEQIAAAGELQLKANPTDTAFQKELANTYNSLARYQLMTEQFAAAEASLLRGFQLDSTNLYLPTNLAPALLLQGKTEAAMQEYQKWKDQPFGQQGLPFYRDAFLADLKEFEKAGIIPAERAEAVELVRKMLLEKKE